MNVDITITLLFFRRSILRKRKDVPLATIDSTFHLCDTIVYEKKSDGYQQKRGAYKGTSE